jgi:hypothetical protein
VGTTSRAGSSASAAAVGSSSPDALGVVRNLTGGVAGTALNPVVALARAVLDPQDGPEVGPTYNPVCIRHRDVRTTAGSLCLPLQEIRKRCALALQPLVIEHRVVDLLNTHAEEMMAELIEADGPRVNVAVGMAPRSLGTQVRP